jgi:hypothetical protein
MRASPHVRIVVAWEGRVVEADMRVLWIRLRSLGDILLNLPALASGELP